MTKNERIIVSAHTGILMCDFQDVHKYIEQILGRPVFIHELADDIVREEIRKKSKKDFMALCGNA